MSEDQLSLRQLGPLGIMMLGQRYNLSVYMIKKSGFFGEPAFNQPIRVI